MINDAQGTIAGLREQPCPGGGWNGMPAELEGKATVADCLSGGGCGCIYGDACRHIENFRAALKRIDSINDNPARYNPEIDAVIRSALEQNVNQ